MVLEELPKALRVTEFAAWFQERLSLCLDDFLEVHSHIAEELRVEGGVLLCVREFKEGFRGGFGFGSDDLLNGVDKI